MRIINTANLTPTTQLTANERSWLYNGLDTTVTQEILEALLPQLDNVSAATYAFARELQAPILEMSTRGILVNQRRKHQVLKKFQAQIDQLDAQLTELVREGVGHPVEHVMKAGRVTKWWRSVTQVKELLYDVMQLPVQRKRNSKGQLAPAVGREQLEKLSGYFIAEPIIAHFLGLRDLDKKRAWLETEIDSDGRMRSNFNIAGTNTGRLASSLSDFGTGGNLQNIDRDLRSVFIADPGMKFANLDLEQADSRNLGALCWELFQSHGETYAGKYLDLCESGDLHTAVSKMARPYLPWPGDKAGDRRVADTVFYRNYTYRDLDKRLGHGSNYLGSPPTMAKHAKVPVDEVKRFQANYFGNLPCIPEYHKYVRGELRDVASLTTLFGRRRFFFGRHDDAATLREAVAYSPQSMTADEINRGMLNIWRPNRIQLLCQVHDSLLFQYPEHLENEIVPWALEQLRIRLTLMRGRDFFVPTEAKVGWNWGDFSDGSKSEANPDGLIKWKGGDDRKRSDLNWKLSVL